MSQGEYKKLLDEIKPMIENKAYEELENSLAPLHPADLADLL